MRHKLILAVALLATLAFGQTKVKGKREDPPECKPPLCSPTTFTVSDFDFNYFRFNHESHEILRLDSHGILHVRLGGQIDLYGHSTFIKQVIIEPEAKWADLAGMIL